VTWVRLDDHFHDHPKIVELSHEAYRVFVGGLCYCARHLTDGKIPQSAVRTLGSKKAAGELVTSGLWDQNGTGVVVHDYLDYQYSAERIRAKRATESARKRGGR
jgi:hypothetical protein